MYVGNLWQDRVYCVDLAAGTSCGDMAAGGALPYTFTYVDSAECIIGLGDAARLFSFTPDFQPCPSGEGEARILPCTCADWTVYWGEIEFDAEVGPSVIWTDEIRGTMVVTERPTLRN